MPLTCAPGRVEASLMDGVKAMAIAVQIDGVWPRGAAHVAGSVRGPDDLRLAAHGVIPETLGGRTWRGALVNPGGRPCVDVLVRIRFHDRDGRPVGSPLVARARWLEPGAVLHLQSRLPEAAVGLRIESLRWVGGGRAARLEPGPPLAFREAAR